MSTCGVAHPTIAGLVCRRDAAHADEDHMGGSAFNRRRHRGMTPGGAVIAWPGDSSHYTDARPGRLPTVAGYTDWKAGGSLRRLAVVR